MPLIYKLVDAAEWEAFRRDGVFRGSAIDRADGFIHFSYADQLGETATRHFSNRAGLVLFVCDGAAFGVALKDEVSRGGALFPHLFAEVPLGTVLWSRPVSLDRDGVPIIDLTENTV